MYHGTSSSNARSILQGGFTPSSGGMLGPGVYCSRDINKARNYGDTVIRVRVDVGRVKVIDCASDRDSSWQSGAYDTAWVKPGVQPSGEEDCVKNPNRIDVLGIAEGSRPTMATWCRLCFLGHSDGVMHVQLVGASHFRLLQS